MGTDPLERIRRATDAFEVLGLPRRFDLDPTTVESSYLELTRLTHPDFAGADVDAQVEAMELSARVNDAHRVVADPEERAEALLQLAGGPGRTESQSLPPGFLEQIVTLREELTEAQGSADHSAVARIEAHAADLRRQHLQRIEALFAQLGSADPGPVQMHRRLAIRTELNAMRYLRRVLEQTHAE